MIMIYRSLQSKNEKTDNLRNFKIITNNKTIFLSNFYFIKTKQWLKNKKCIDYNKLV